MELLVKLVKINKYISTWVPKSKVMSISFFLRNYKVGRWWVQRWMSTKIFRKLSIKCRIKFFYLN